MSDKTAFAKSFRVRANDLGAVFLEFIDVRGATHSYGFTIVTARDISKALLEAWKDRSPKAVVLEWAPIRYQTRFGPDACAFGAAPGNKPGQVALSLQIPGGPAIDTAMKLDDARQCLRLLADAIRQAEHGPDNKTAH